MAKINFYKNIINEKYNNQNHQYYGYQYHFNKENRHLFS